MSDPKLQESFAISATTMESRLPEMRDQVVAIIGLGYVGLPLALAFSRIWQVIGFDIDQARIDELRNGIDRTKETNLAATPDPQNPLLFTSDAALLEQANVFIVTVPTPINNDKTPNLSALESATALVAKSLEVGDTVIYESTVYPGCTEEICVPILESVSGLKFNVDFSVGYSPERINPGDTTRRLENIKKITSGSTSDAANFVDELYRTIIDAGTHRAESIKVAEAAKIIENTQRDLNIALINELAIIFSKMGIDTESVLRAAETKWNFSAYRPGLVGGHCIGVDPYYLTYKAEVVGHKPEVILAGRRLNDDMGRFVAEETLSLASRRGIDLSSARGLVLGITFKEDCPDIRNSLVPRLIERISEGLAEVQVHDPHADPAATKAMYGLDLIPDPSRDYYDVVVVAVAHDTYKRLGKSWIDQLCSPIHVIYDLKCILPWEPGVHRP